MPSDNLIYRLAHTWELEPSLLTRTRELLNLVFDGEMTDEDWDHCLGGIHAIALKGTEPIAHAAVIQRQLLQGDRPLRCGYVEGVAVHPDYQRKGIGKRLMTQLEPVIRNAYDLGALGATDDAVPLYSHSGWQLWRGPLFSLTPKGTIATPDEQGGVWVLRTRTPLDLDSQLTCDFRIGDVW